MEKNMSDEEEQGRLEKPRYGFLEGILVGILASLTALVVFLAGWRLAGGREEAKKPEEEQAAEVLTSNGTLWKLAEIQNLIQDNYLREVDSELLSSYLFKGIAVGLDDPYANYYSAEELQSVMDSDRGAYTGIGVLLGYDTVKKEFRVQEVYENTPAEQAGLQAGDVLRTVDGVSLADQTLDGLVAQIKKKQEPFELTIYRPASGETLTLEMACGEVEMQAVRYEWAADGIGLIRISEFTKLAVEQFQEAVQALQQEKLEALIVDLRGNPGGLLDSVCSILDEVLPERLLVYTEDKDGKRTEYRSDRRRLADCPVAVLVDEGSASASEIFAGAIQDYAAGPVVGAVTYGKGVVQKTYPLRDGSAFKMTVETYYTPLGQEIDGNGITPDILVEEPEAEPSADGADRGEENEAEDLALAEAVRALQAGWNSGDKAE